MFHPQAVLRAPLGAGLRGAKLAKNFFRFFSDYVFQGSPEYDTSLLNHFTLPRGPRNLAQGPNFEKTPR